MSENNVVAKAIRDSSQYIDTKFDDLNNAK